MAEDRELLEPTFNVSIRDLFRTKPGDRCPDVECPGVILKITMMWDKEYFTVDAHCSHCDSWTLEEQHAAGAGPAD